MAQSVSAEPGLELTQEQIGAYLGHLAAKGCRESSVAKYRRDLSRFYAMLPEDKRVRRGTVSAWRTALVERGYDPQLGARPLRRVVQQTVENIVAQLLLSQLIQTGSSVEIDRAMLEAELER